MSEIPVERRTYYPLPQLDAEMSRACPVCGRQMLTPWYLRRDRDRRVYRRWVCLNCQAQQDISEEESA